MDIQDIFDRAGGATELARQLGLAHQGIYQWRKVPPHRVFQVCRLTGLRPFDVRPDLYPDPKWRVPPRAA